MLEQLNSLGLYLNQPEPAMLCIHCKFALKADGDRVSRHLGERHGISKLARRGLNAFIHTLRLPDPETLPGAACRYCGLRSTSLKVLSQHMNKAHPRLIQYSKRYSHPNSHWLQGHILDQLSLQTWTIGNIERSWTVHLYNRQLYSSHTAATLYQAPEAVQVFAKDLYAREQQYLSQEATQQPTKLTTNTTDLALVTNWMRRTGWEATFCDTQRDLLISTPFQPFHWLSPTSPPMTGTSSPTEWTALPY
ncbi:hypothetical protein H9Q69_012933 [Fusarium xylarioides]|nr:hypothetical protein H9Q69_012933 [Fusarium xylarioides]